MPTLAYRRRRFPTKRRQPKKFIWTVVGAQTYEKAGALFSGGELTGADVFEAAEAGSLLAGASLSGTSEAILQRSLLLRGIYSPVITRRRRRGR